MLVRKLVAALAMAAALNAGYVGEARALASGSVVYDPANHAENIISAIQAIRANVLSESQLAQEIITAVNTVNQYKQMLKDYQVTVNQMRGMSFSQIFSLAKNMGGEVAVYADLAERLGRTDRNLRSVLDMYKEIERMGNYTNMSPTQIFYIERQRRQQENSYLRDRFTNIQRTLTSVNGDIRKIDQLRAAIPDSQMDGEQSMRKALENVSMHLNLMAGQNTQLLAVMAEESAAKSASGVSQRAISEAQEWNEYVRAWQEEWRIKQKYQQANDAAAARWRTVP